jgi:hypothetical protein
MEATLRERKPTKEIQIANAVFNQNEGKSKDNRYGLWNNLINE